MFRSVNRLVGVSLILAVAAFAAAPRTEAAQAGNSWSVAQERRQIDQGGSFPYLGTHYVVLSPSTDRYNCIAWSLGITTRWINPGATLRHCDQLNRQLGYRRIRTLDYRVQAGVEKIVLYGKVKPDGSLEYTHQARQARDGTWTSKLGKMALVRHATPESLNGPVYGQPVAVYVRTVRR
jgi:hypothetical protein